MKKNAPVKEILAKNLRERRRKCGLSQEKLAEKAGISTQYLAMIEIARKFPASGVLENLACALDIHVYELFLVDHSPREELELLRRDILAEMKRSFADIVHAAVNAGKKYET
jgi:transcriptional regulator with XRE-family HTH domain